MTTFVIFVLIGILAGTLSGLFGIGGGIVTVPCLLYAFNQLDFPTNSIMQVSVGTSLGAMILTSTSSAWAHILKSGVRWRWFCSLAPGILFGTIFGAIIADSISSRVLELFFAISVIIFGFYFLLFKKNEETGKNVNIPKNFLLVIAGVLIGVISALLGIGGGVLMVPLLTAFKVPLKNAISTSSVTGVIIAIVGAISYLFFGFDNQTYNGGFGYLYLPAFIIIGITSTIFAPIGAKLAYTLPIKILSKLFAILLILVGLNILF